MSSHRDAPISGPAGRLRRAPCGEAVVPLPVHRAADAPPAADVELSVSVHADGRQIVVRRHTAPSGSARRTVHIDAIVRG
ncbi:MAG TPA: hypothetical protein VFS08_09475 [Gemmatimonadaceae bacterium]|nr:hypothetical protein [Gemmatimonadaceae bacterium]